MMINKQTKQVSLKRQFHTSSVPQILQILRTEGVTVMSTTEEKLSDEGLNRNSLGSLDTDEDEEGWRDQEEDEPDAGQLLRIKEW